MKYGKLINNQLVLAPNPIIIADRQIGNPPGEVYISDGYKPVVYTDPPTVEPGYAAVPGWEENVLEIVQVWTVEQVPITEEDALVRYSNELTGQQDETLTEVSETLIKQIIEEEN